MPAAPWAPRTPEGGRGRGRAGADPGFHPAPTPSLVAGYQPRGGSASAAAASWLGAALAARGSPSSAAPSTTAAGQGQGLGLGLGFCSGLPSACGPQREQPRRLGSLEAGGLGLPAELGFGACQAGSPSGSLARSDSGGLQRRGSSSGSTAGSEGTGLTPPGRGRSGSLGSLGAGEAPGDVPMGEAPASRGSPAAGGPMGSPAPSALATVLEDRAVGAQTPPAGQAFSQGFAAQTGLSLPPPPQPPTPPSLPQPLHPLTPPTRGQARPTWAWTPEAPRSAFQGAPGPASALAAASRDLWAGDPPVVSGGPGASGHGGLWAGVPPLGAGPSGGPSGEGHRGGGPTAAEAAAEDEGAAALLRELSLASGASGSDPGDAADGSSAPPLPPMRQARVL